MINVSVAIRRALRAAGTVLVAVAARGRVVVVAEVVKECHTQAGCGWAAARRRRWNGKRW